MRYRVINLNNNWFNNFYYLFQAEFTQTVISKERDTEHLKSSFEQLEKNFLDIKSQFDNLNELNSELHDKIAELQVLLNIFWFQIFIQNCISFIIDN